MPLPRVPIVLSMPVSERDHALGPADAPVTLLEYGDYECPYCGKTHPVIRKLRETMSDRLRFAFRNFPLNSVHPRASVAAQAAEAAGAQGKFWPMHDVLYAHQDTLADHDLHEFALKIGLEIYKFDADLASQRFARRVSEDFESGQSSGVTGTPTLFINGVRYNGPKDFDSLLNALEAAAKG